jgi:hypothetical protein
MKSQLDKMSEQEALSGQDYATKKRIQGLSDQISVCPWLASGQLLGQQLDSFSKVALLVLNEIQNLRYNLGLLCEE